MTIKTISYDQAEILKGIMSLCGIERFCADVTYGNGAFYRDIPEPILKFDVDEGLEGCIKASSDNLPMKDASIQSLVFDPPFLTYIRAGRGGNGSMAMARRFSGYWKYEELESHYKATIKEAARVLQKGGIMVFKCQDIIHNHKMHCTHANIIGWASEQFRLKDLFLLLAKHRMPSPNRRGVQKHARIYHSYFLVFEKKR